MKKRPPPIDWVSELTEAVKLDLSINQLSEKLGVRPSAVHKHEHRTGIRLKRVRMTTPHKGNSSGIDWPPVLREAQEAGLSGVALARKLNVTLGAVLGAEDRTGIFLRRRHPNKFRLGGFRNKEDNT